MTGRSTLALIALALVVVGTQFYGQLGLTTEGRAWMITDVACGLISLALGIPMLAQKGLGRAFGVALMVGVGALVLFHLLALPIAGPVRTVHPGWKYIDGYNAALWGTVALRAVV